MKQARQFAIKEILAAREIPNQVALREELKKKGFHVTQATLSRDLRELGVARFPDRKRAHYAFQPAAEARILQPLVGAQVVSVSSNESLIVVRTIPGCAGAVGEFLDAQNAGDIIGTIAGDNTLLIIPRSHKRVRHILKFLKQKLFEGTES
jgi:transcriptional regulator of arginine metabolism